MLEQLSAAMNRTEHGWRECSDLVWGKKGLWKKSAMQGPCLPLFSCCLGPLWDQECPAGLEVPLVPEDRVLTTLSFLLGVGTPLVLPSLGLDPTQVRWCELKSLPPGSPFHSLTVYPSLQQAGDEAMPCKLPSHGATTEAILGKWEAFLLFRYEILFFINYPQIYQ